MKICISNKIKAIILILILWQILSMFNNEIVVPSIVTVVKALIKILTDKDSLLQILITLSRLTLSMIISIVAGIILGITFVFLKSFKNMFKEMMHIFQVVPPVSVLIMAIIWFGLNGVPAMFIVGFSLIPLISINVINSIESIDEKLIEMSNVFKFTRLMKIIHIYIPAIKKPLFTAITISLTMGAKMIVMGEVLTTQTGIGGRITTARLNIEPEVVVAWTVIMICLYYILEKVLDVTKEKIIRY